MRVLCFHSHKIPDFHINYVAKLMEIYPQTTIETGRYLHLLDIISDVAFDIILLFCDDQSILSVSGMRRATKAIRAKQPASLIIIHRYSPGRLTRLFRSISEGLCDFSFDRNLNPVFLPRFAQTLWFRRQEQLLSEKQSRCPKGMIAVKDFFGNIMTSRLSELNIQVYQTDVTEDFEKQFQQLRPDFVVVHCHNRKGDFEVVKRTTHLIRSIHPACVIYLTYTFITPNDNKSPYRYDEYSYDALVDGPVNMLRVLIHLNPVLGLWHHLSSSIPIKKPPCIA